MKEAIRFGKYLFLERINVGGMAEVFKAKTFGVEGFEKLVAVKRILPSIAEDDEFIKMFIDEAKITVRLQHANIAQVYELGKLEDSYFIAMEFINGKDLKQLFERAKKLEKPMDIAQASYIISQLCAGLDYAHRKKDDRGVDLNIVHRDVSPQNIRISYDGEVKVIDFGIAKAKNKSSKTEAGILKGKFGYMSPEQVRGKTIDRRSDIFAIGIIFYELLTATRLFQGETDFSTLEKIRNVDIEPITNRNPKIPKELEEIVMKALTSKREQRYKFAHDMHDDLQKFMILNNYMYSRTDLANWMKKTYFKDIEKDLKKLKEFDDYDHSDFNNNNSSINNDNSNNKDNEPIEWDDDELETQIFDKSPSFVGETPDKDSNRSGKNSKLENLPKKDLVKEIKDKKKKQKKQKVIMFSVAAIFIILLLAVVYNQFLSDKPDGDVVKKYLDYEMNVELQAIPNNNLNIYLDNKLKGKNEKTPFLVTNIKPGTHKLKVEKSGYFTLTKEIKIPSMTRKDTVKLSSMRDSEAIKLYGITSEQYVSSNIDLLFQLKEKTLKDLSINVTPSTDIKVFFEDKELASSPYSVKNLKLGKYKIKVIKDGFNTYDSEIIITNEDLSKNSKLISIKLEKGKLVPIDVKTTPNTRLFVDGKEIKGKSPYKIEVTEGRHLFKIQGGMFVTVTKNLDCKENSSFNLKSKQKYVNLTIDSSPKGAKIYFFDKDNLKSVAANETPFTKKIEISNLSAIKLEKSGYKTSSLRYKWNGKFKQVLNVKFQKNGSSVRIVKKTKKVNKKKNVKKATKYGYISIISKPATSIKVDGRNLGRKTPLIKFKIPAGTHRITLYNRAKGINNSFTVKVIANKVKPIIKKY